MSRSRFFQCQSVNDAFLWLAHEVYHHPDYVVSPRGLTTKEVVCTQVEILDPYQRVVTNKHRAVSLRYCVGEWLWYERASNRLDEIAAYSRFWTHVSDNHRTVNSAYGYRIFGKHPASNINQWNYVLSELSTDRHSRRAILVLAMPYDMATPTKDFLCTVYLQFLIRNSKLHLMTSMRSNDLILGFPNDVFAFTLFQEKMLLELQKDLPGLEIGSYHHLSTSTHLYEKHYSLVEKILAHPEENISVQIPRMDNLRELRDLQYNEAIIRTGQNGPLRALSDAFCLFCQQILLGSTGG